MEHAQKVILVPAELTQQTNPLDLMLDSLDQDMQKILKNKKLGAEVKLSMYNQILNRFSKLQEKKRQPYQLDIVDKNISTITDDKILAGMPESLKNTAKSFLQHIRTNPSIKIDPSGEIVIHGQKIHGSNIVDLVHCFSRDRKIPSPVGAEKLSRLLEKSNIPLEHIGSHRRREDINRRRLNWDEQ